VDDQAHVTGLLERLVALMDADELSAAPVLEVGSIHGAGKVDDLLPGSEPDADDRPDPVPPDSIN
jgi:hypothetical protein